VSDDRQPRWDDDDDHDQDPRPEPLARLRLWHVLALGAGIVLFWVLLSGCTIIAFNRAPVTTTESDSHDADGTNVHTWDFTLSPR
jgi:hypothetical protein